MSRAAKPQRMSELFGSSAKAADATQTTATPPYSSEGPTLPIISAAKEHLDCDATKAPPSGSKKRKLNTKKDAQDHPNTKTAAAKQPQQATIHPSLYQPWTLLPPEILKLLESQNFLRPTENIVSVVFSKNQNVKSGINKLKTYLGNYKNEKSTTKIPDAMDLEDVLIAVSAQGEGTTKLVGIMDMVRRIVAPKAGEAPTSPAETWTMYTVLSSVDVDRRRKDTDKDAAHSTSRDEVDDDTIPIDARHNDNTATEAKNTRKVPVLTIWLARKKIPAFANAFGEQTLNVQKAAQEPV